MLQIRSLKYRVLGMNVRSLYMVAILILSSFNFSLAQKTGGATDEARNIPNYKELWANEPFAKYDPATEIIEKRDQVSKHFRNPDGSVTAHIASGPIHYWEDGQWKTIFHTIEASTNGGYLNKFNSFKTNYPKLSSGEIVTILPDGNVVKDMQGMRMYYETNGAELSAMNINSSEGKGTFNEMLYSGVYGPDIDLRLTQHTSVRKMDYILKNSSPIHNAPEGSQYLVFEENILLPSGMEPKLEDNKINLYFNGNLYAQYLNPEIIETTNSKRTKQKIDITQGIYAIEFIDRRLKVKLKIPLDWLMATSRSFPIVVDPSINFTPNTTASWTGAIETARSSTGPDYTAYTGNMWSASYYSSGIQGSTSKIFVGVYDYNYNGSNKDYDRQAFHSWAKFNTSTIADNSTINSVNLYSYVELDYAVGLGIDLTKITTEPVANSISNRLTEIRGGSVYNADIQSLNNGGSAWANYTLGGTANSDLQSLLSSDWFSVGYKSIGQVAYINDFVRISGQAEVNKPYIAVTYTTVTVPIVTTTTASSITNFTASSGGNVTSDGGASVTARGVLWGTSPGLAMPSANSTSNGTGTGTFTSSITGLSASTVYYYRAYAYNSVGYGYGAELSFVTTGPSAEGYYISGNIVNNGEIVSTYDENYLRMTGTSKTITGSGKFTNSKLFADGSTSFDAGLNASSKFSETYVNANKSLTIENGRTFANGTMSNYGTLTLNGTGIITNSANLVNGGTLTVASTGEITVGGTWTNNSTFTPGSGLVTFDGSNNSIIGGSSALSFYKLKMNKSASSVTTTLAANATITNTLTLTVGKLVTDSYIAYVSNNASGAISGGSSNSYVQGKLKRAVTGIANYTFPVGQSLYEEAQLNFTTGYTSADITAFFTDGSPGNLPSGGLTVSGTPLTSILDKGYWSIDPSSASGSPTYSVTLKETGHANGATSPSQYTVIKRTNSPSILDWALQGTHSNTTQADAGGVVTAVRSGLTSFSDFAIGYGGGALPIELTSFQANCSDQNTVEVTWTTASEHNTNYFRVDKSRNGTQWDVLGTIGAAGNSTYTIDYALSDAFPNPGINYYRLTQYDLDGVFETFDAQAAVCKDQQAGTALSSYPNPSTSDFNVDLQTDELEGEGVLMITDAKGAVVHSQDIKIIKGNNNYVIQKFNAEPGIYYISVKAGANTVTTKHSLR